MFLALFVILLVMWLAGFLAFHVASGAIHILLAIAVIVFAAITLWSGSHARHRGNPAADSLAILDRRGRLDRPRSYNTIIGALI